MNSSQKLLAAATIALLVGGCAVGPDYKPPATATPASFAESGTLVKDRAVATTQPVTERWWTQFNDPKLDSLLASALQQNRDLRTAAARIREARALRGVAVSAYYPGVDGSASYRRSHLSQNGSIGDLGGAAAGGSAGGAGGGLGGFPGFDLDQDLYQAGFDASWELDVFGGVRRSVESADATIAVAQDNLRDVLLSLQAEVARNYLDLRGLQRQMDIVRRNITSQRDTLELSRTRFQAGLTGEFDVQRAAAQVAITEAQIPSIEASIRRTIHRLGVLTGAWPQALLEDLLAQAPPPPLPPQIPVGLPSELLRRRPDVRRAERQLAAATANIGVATADLFPRFSITGQAGLQSSKFSSLGNWDSHFYGIGPAISLPIFNAGRLRSIVNVENARQEQALNQYEQSVLIALEDVENALISYAEEQIRHQRLDDAVAANREAYKLATERYQKGIDPFLNVLDAQRSLLLSEEQLVISERSLAQDVVAVFKALGGGWESIAPPATQPASPPSAR